MALVPVMLTFTSPASCWAEKPLARAMTGSITTSTLEPVSWMEDSTPSTSGIAPIMSATWRDAAFRSSRSVLTRMT